VTEKAQPSKRTRARPSPTAPEIVATSYLAWEDALSDPRTRPAIEKGLEDVRRGRTKPWAEVRKRIK